MLQRFVTFLKFRKMRFDRHVASLLSLDCSLTPSRPTSTTRILPFGSIENPHCALVAPRDGRACGPLTKTRYCRTAYAAFSRAPVHDPAGLTSAAMTTEEERELREELARLQQLHRDLDAAIAALQDSPGADIIQVQRLKKRKLQLRDRITFIEDQLTPDIIA